MTPAEAEKMCNSRDDTCHGCDLWPEEDDDPDPPQAIAWTAYSKAFAEAMGPRLIIKDCTVRGNSGNGISIASQGVTFSVDSSSIRTMGRETSNGPDWSDRTGIAIYPDRSGTPEPGSWGAFWVIMADTLCVITVFLLVGVGFDWLFNLIKDAL